MNTNKSRKGFTLIELLVVIAVVAILSVVVILTLNPSELLKQSRDSSRLSDLSTINSALSIYTEDQGGGSLSMGIPGVVYLSLPDPTATTTAGTNCAGTGISTTSITLHCPSPSNLKNIDGTGWIPVNFSNVTISPPLSALPIDPINQSSTNAYYTYQTDGQTAQINAVPESQKEVTVLNSAPSTFTTGNSALTSTSTTNLIGLPSSITGSNATGYTVVENIKNTGAVNAYSFQVLTARLNAVSSTTALPIAIGTIVRGATAQVTLTFPPGTAADGANVILQVTWSFTGYNGGASGRVIVP